MKYLPLVLFLFFIVSMILSLLYFDYKMTAMETVNNMGLGYNFANTFECYNKFEEIKTPEEQITLWGNIVPTKNMISKLKRYGFKTIRLPITWINFIDSTGKIDSEWLSYIRNVIDWIINDNNMFCIINVHGDGKDDNWLSKGISVKNIFINLWKQIAEEFINYDEHLIFESVDNPNYYISYDSYDFDTLLVMTQAFIDTIRSTGGNNKDRLLLISGANSQIEIVCTDNYKLPNDPSNKIALTINYFIPSSFCLEKRDTKWGTETDYKEMFIEFETLKKAYIDKGIPVIITAYSILTEENKEKESIREYIYFENSLASSYNGMSSFIWDTSTADMNFYDRENDKWFDEEIQKSLKKISRGKLISPLDFSYVSNIDTVNSTSNGNMKIKIGRRRVLTAIFNIKIIDNYSWSVGFGITGFDRNGVWLGIQVNGDIGRKEYDGTYTYIVDISYKDYNDYVEIQQWWGGEIIYNYFSLEFEQSHTFFDYNKYKNAFLNNNI